MTLFELPMVVAGLIALRFERAVSKVERVSEALAVGELSARVETGGPSDELRVGGGLRTEPVERCDDVLDFSPVR